MKLFGFDVVASPDVPPDELHVCEKLPTRVETDATTVRTIQEYRVVAKITGLGITD